MKHIMILLLLIAGGLQAHAQLRSATLQASGLTCSMCNKAIYKALEKVPFVKSIDVNIDKATFTVMFKEGEKASPDELKKAVEDAGFSVADMKVTAAFSNAEVYNDAHIAIGNNTYHFLDVERQTLQGERAFTIVDKNYLSAAAHKKYGRYTKMKCFETGMMESCCPNSKHEPSRVYHVTL